LDLKLKKALGRDRFLSQGCQLMANFRP